MRKGNHKRAKKLRRKGLRKFEHLMALSRSWAALHKWRTWWSRWSYYKRAGPEGWKLLKLRETLTHALDVQSVNQYSRLLMLVFWVESPSELIELSQK